MSIDAGDEHDLERDAAGDDPPERLDPIPEHLDVREERSVLGAKTGEIIVRCKLCLETAPVDEWRSLTHKTDCKHPIESYQTANGSMVVQSLGSSSAWVSSSTPVEREDAAERATPDAGVSRGVQWEELEEELGEER